MAIKTFTQPACPFCGIEGNIIHHSLKDRLFGVPGRWAVRRCVDPACDLVWLDPMPFEAEVVQLYKDYYTHNKTTPLKKSHPLQAMGRMNLKMGYSVIKRMFNLKEKRRRLKYMFLEPGRDGKKLLEVGCGSGARLRAFKDKGWQVTGQELDPQAATYAKTVFDVNVLLGDLVDIGLDGEQFDAIVMNHVIEHIYDPARMLTECNRILKPGGKVVISTPNIESYGHAVFGENWRGLEPPRHLHLFSNQSAVPLMQKAGFSQYKIWTSAARAASMAHGSIDLALFGSHTMGERPRQMVFFREIIFQYKALQNWSQHQNSGEELIIKAEKTPRQ